MYKYAILFCLACFSAFAQAPAPPIITASTNDDVVCSGSSVTLTATGCAGTLQWSNGVTTSSIVVSPSLSASYAVFCTTAGGQSHASYSFGVVPKPTLSASSANLCAGENVVLSIATGNVQSSAFVWKRDGGLLSDASGTSYIANQAGTYTIEDTATLGAWVTYNPVPHNYTYRDVYFTDANTGYAVGDNGIIYKTTDAGAIWLPLNSGTTNSLYAVQFTDANTGYVISQYNYSIYKTTNAGQSWTQINSYSNTNYSRYGLFFTTSSVGWTIGSSGNIEKTADGGQSWTTQISGTTQTLRKVFFIDANTGWVVGDNGTILKTANGGQNWSAQSSGTTRQLNAVQFINASEGWAVGDNGTFLKTVDGGATWVVKPIQYFTNYLYTLHFFNSNEGIVAGDYGYARTTDGGNTFVDYYNSNLGNSKALFFVNASVGYSVGESGHIAKTENAGISWQSYADNYKLENINRISFADETNGWGLADGRTLVKSTDGGKSWVKANVQPGSGNESMYGLQFKNATTGWICGFGSIFKTSDGGQSWTKQFAQNNKYLQDIFFLGTQIGWAVGYHYLTNAQEGYILRTTDGGANWQSMSVGSSSLQKVFFVSSSTGWAVGSNGTIYKSTDGGVNWSQQSSGTSNSLSSIYFQDANIGWAGGYNSLLRTQDGGNTWVSAYSNFILPVTIKIDNGIGWVIDYQRAYYTVNNGQTWTNVDYGGSYQQVNTGAIFPSGNMYAAGNGRWMKFFPKPATCNASPVAILSAPAAPTVTASTATALCEGEPITLTASGCSGTLSWSNGGTAAAITVTPYASTTYTAYCAGTNGCKSTAYSGVAVLPKVRLDTASSATCNRPIFTAANSWQGIPLVWKKDGVVFQETTTTQYTAREAGVYQAEPKVAGLWASQSGTYTNGDLNDVVFPSASVGFAIGSRGEILKTTNGGLNWQTLQSGSTSYLRRIQMLDANTGFVAGYNNTVLKTTDGGTSWAKLKSNGNFFNDLSFANVNTGWLVEGNKIHYTSDGGNNWTVQYSAANNYPNSIHATSASTAWAVGVSGLVLKTTNGGASWNSVNVGSTSSLNEVYFSDATHGWILGNDKTVLRTVDGGNNWTLAAPVSSNNNSFNNVYFVDSQTGWMNSGNYFYKTTDGGISWIELPQISQSSGYPNRFVMLNNSEGVFVGSRGTIARTSDGVNTWQNVDGSAKNYLNYVQFVNNNEGFILGSDRTFMSTTDGGKNWVARKVNSPDFYGGNDLFFVNTSYGWIPSYNDLFKTTNGGVNWTKYTYSGGGGPFQSVYFTSTAIGYSVGNSGRILKTTDGGNTWNTQTTGTTQNLRKIFFADASHGWAVGDNGTILATTNAGTTWALQSSGTTTSFGSVHFNSINDGWATTSGVNGLYRTVNGGSTWTQVIIDPNSVTYPSQAQFLDSNTGFVLANEFVYATTDGGATWKKSFNHNTSNSMYFTDATHGWVVGYNGSILTYVPAPAACPSAPVTVQPQSIAPLSTLASGNWSSSSVWSCGFIPTALDAVRINQTHTVTLPTGYTAKAKNIEMWGNMQYGGANAGLQMGQE